MPLLASIMQLLDPEHALGALSVGERLGQWYRLRASGVGAVAGVGLVLVGSLFTAARGAGSWWRRLALLPVALLCSGLLVAADNRGALVATAAGQ